MPVWVSEATVLGSDTVAGLGKWLVSRKKDTIAGNVRSAVGKICVGSGDSDFSVSLGRVWSSNAAKWATLNSEAIKAGVSNDVARAVEICQSLSCETAGRVKTELAARSAEVVHTDLRRFWAQVLGEMRAMLAQVKGL